MYSTKMAPTTDPTPFVAENHRDGKRHLLLAASGSVATIKLPNMVNALGRHDHLSIRIVVTESARRFLAGQSREQPDLERLRKSTNVDGIYVDEDEWRHPWTRGAGILHIELRRWADLLLIAPLSANSLAKIVAGLSDNLLLSVVRAWEGKSMMEEGVGRRKTIVVAPAMNTAMWNHPVTSQHLRVVEDDWGLHGRGQDGYFEVLRPVEKTLACGDVGEGAMMDWNDIVRFVEGRLGM